MHSPSRKVQFVFKKCWYSAFWGFLMFTEKSKWLVELKIYLFSLFVDDGQGAAGVEDSSLHLKLEKRKGIVLTKIFNFCVHAGVWFFSDVDSLNNILLLEHKILLWSTRLTFTAFFVSINFFLLICSLPFRVTPFLWTNVWLLMDGACKRFTSMKTLPSLLKRSTSPIERCAPSVHECCLFLMCLFLSARGMHTWICIVFTGQRGSGDESPGGEEDGPEGEGKEGGETQGAGPDGSRPQGRD